ncbi:lytic polysaccharide monooxygenase [Kribbella sp. NPDC056345]|uniref:lytic polysaccharide monooxygenase auxiliary activity family 9 protein n=1 Tax=Kribbella sp. NPDC056345 TaxID=3345789 RepID=UPI0035DBC87A
MRLLRPFALSAALLGLTGALLVALPAPVAQAHGAFTFPGSRTYLCYVNGKEGGNGGDLRPTNPACADAWNNGDHYPFWNWFSNLISNAGGRHREIIPDGNLCGPDARFAKFRAARSDWPTTNLKPGSTINIRYNAWAPHPGTWTQYITRDGWNINEPLRWSDLEPAPWNEVTNPPLNGSGPEGPEWTWPATLPANKTGRHIIYSIWQRSDSPEAFYQCADVNLTTGSGDPTPPPPPPPPPTSCSVTYSTPSQWNNGFTASVKVTNTGQNPVGGWTVRWTWPNGQRVVGEGWDATVVNNGATGAIASNASWNSVIRPGESVTFGFNGSHTGTNGPPTDFVACKPASTPTAAGSEGVLMQMLTTARSFQHLAHDHAKHDHSKHDHSAHTQPSR